MPSPDVPRPNLNGNSRPLAPFWLRCSDHRALAGWRGPSGRPDSRARCDPRSARAGCDTHGRSAPRGAPGLGASRASRRSHAAAASPDGRPIVSCRGRDTAGSVGSRRGRREAGLGASAALPVNRPGNRPGNRPPYTVGTVGRFRTVSNRPGRFKCLISSIQNHRLTREPSRELKTVRWRSRNRRWSPSSGRALRPQGRHSEGCRGWR